MGDGKKSKSVIVGWRYFMGVQFALCQGPVDKIRRIIIGEREAWIGSIIAETPRSGLTSLTCLVAMTVRVVLLDTSMSSWVHRTNRRNAYLAKHQGATCPAYRGLVNARIQVVHVVIR